MALPAGTIFQQTLAVANGRGVAPAQANVWDLDPDFSIGDGGDDQLDGALELQVAVGGASAQFPSDQIYSELTALGPTLGTADQLLAVSFSADAAFATSSNATGRYAFLHAGVDVRLQQVLDLRAATGGISLSWTGSLGQLDLRDFADPSQFIQVVLRDSSGGLLAMLYRTDLTGSTGTWASASLTAYAGQVVVLSFEQRTGKTGSAIDNVSVKDSTSREFVVNGDFEAQASGWLMSDAKASQNVRSGVRTLRGLEVQRSFFAQPDQPWGRVTDVFHNASAAPVTAVVTYINNLGSDDGGVIYPTPGASLKGLTTWDSGYREDRDIGFVFGAADSRTFQSASVLNLRDGSDEVRCLDRGCLVEGAWIEIEDLRHDELQ
ncbi:hypothetical protein [Variovorax saccharolyticus]|uniref:hypothetical protein n=1 Tax=Variovorax saccharolyticus TaxID=3053516 RepID=UPI002575C0AB|nr:hypothetical protein [Variovorax sp. J22R187]MDM0020694.1 hypothetical protein [Variovorax sp. J22R187]